MVQALPAAAPRKQQLEAARQKCSLAAGGLAACQFGMACGLQPAACSLQPAACSLHRAALTLEVVGVVGQQRRLPLLQRHTSREGCRRGSNPLAPLCSAAVRGEQQARQHLGRC